MWDARQSGNVNPESHRIALRQAHPLSPDRLQRTPALFQEPNSWPQNFAWDPYLIRRRYRARFRPADSLSQNYRVQPPSSRLSLPRSIPSKS